MSKILPTTLTDFALYAAEQFLQTAVFVDDKIYDRKTGAVSEPRALQKPSAKRKVALKSAESTAISKTSSVVNEPIPADGYSRQDIVTSFAKRQIVCSLYQPKQNASVGQNSEVYLLCLASDIVIVDWDLYGDAGTKAIELVCHLVEQSRKDIPEQIRLILIYTDEKNLFEVTNRIFERLQETLKNDVEPIQEQSGLVLKTPNSRITVFGKPGERGPQYRDYIVSGEKLAERSIAEFSYMASGMLQGAVLIGLSEIRKNSRQILSKFEASLDPAFLTHRALSLPDDASDHILPLLIAEIQSILEDQLDNPIVTKELIENWCDRWIPQSHAESYVSSADPRKVAKDFCLEGSEAVKKIGLKDEKLYSFLLSSPTSEANRQLSVLMSQRTHYGKVRRRLRLGTILKDQSDKFLICLQPVCDSVRIQEARRFLMVELQQSTAGKFNTIVVHKDQWFELLFKPKGFHCVVVEFRSSGADKAVVAIEQEDGSFTFTSSNSDKYQWIAQLKSEHAQRVAGQFAEDLSRVGLTESEWLRRKAK